MHVRFDTTFGCLYLLFLIAHMPVTDRKPIANGTCSLVLIEQELYRSMAKIATIKHIKLVI